MAIFVALKSIKHDGENYVCGDVIEEMKKIDSDRLKKLGVVKEIDGKNEDKPAGKKQKEN